MTPGGTRRSKGGKTLSIEGFLGFEALAPNLTPTEKGLPIEIYVFSNDRVWANYEALQAGGDQLPWPLPPGVPGTLASAT